jgi:hypothetical protein
VEKNRLCPRRTLFLNLVPLATDGTIVAQYLPNCNGIDGGSSCRDPAEAGDTRRMRATLRAGEGTPRPSAIAHAATAQASEFGVLAFVGGAAFSGDATRPMPTVRT